MDSKKEPFAPKSNASSLANLKSKNQMDAISPHHSKKNLPSRFAVIEKSVPLKY